MTGARSAVFRTDASHAIGGGHAMRCLTLARQLAMAGFSSRLFVAAAFEDVVPSEAVEGITVTCMTPSIPFSDQFAAAYPAGADLLVYDHYGLAAADEAATRGLARCTLVIDDLANRPHDCDILVDQTVGQDARIYDALVSTDCVRLVGGDFCLIRPEFAAKRVEALARRPGPLTGGRLLVTMGLTDVGGVTAQTIAALPADHPFASVDVLLAEGTQSWPAAHALAARDRRIVLHRPDSTDVASLMTAADVAIGSAGTTSWERCCLGLPSIVLALADNQTTVIAELCARDAIVLAGTPSEAAAHACDLASRAERRAELSRNAARLVDGRGADRVVEAVTRLLERA